ncbi:hypothetical protein [Saccharolobus shibatae]|uniref:Uncharacterized protein n=1 Tax=Saccharolobus shibatae TaxID=2286 RepID=A0A8F5C0Y0_9CREN|nr:hypothetical protein [Saccharolobus shibatae]QXJ35006.1 hypothetical protein J5U22_01553 [Saccharolobus shibatae]
MAFLIASANGDTLQVFAPDTDGVIYVDHLEDVKSECGKYIRLFSSYDQNIIKSTSVKLWHYYANKEVKFTDEEKNLLSELGIKV